MGFYLIYSLRSEEIRYSVLSYAICGWLNSSRCKQIFMVQQHFRFLILSIALNNFTSFFSPNENCVSYFGGKFLGIRVWPPLSMVTSSLYWLGSKLFLQDLNGTCAILSRRVCVEDIASAPKHSLEPRLTGVFLLWIVVRGRRPFLTCTLPCEHEISRLAESLGLFSFELLGNWSTMFAING